MSTGPIEQTVADQPESMEGKFPPPFDKARCHSHTTDVVPAQGKPVEIRQGPAAVSESEIPSLPLPTCRWEGAGE